MSTRLSCTGQSAHLHTVNSKIAPKRGAFMIIVAKDYIRVRQQTFSLNEPEAHTPSALVPIVADNLEVRNLTGISHMVAGAGADVVVAYTHQA